MRHCVSWGFCFYTFHVGNIALIVHGGAWDISANLTKTCKDGVTRALKGGWRILENGGSCLDACEQAIVELEDEPVFDAGVGSHVNRDGTVQLDAILMNAPISSRAPSLPWNDSQSYSSGPAHS